MSDTYHPPTVDDYRKHLSMKSDEDLVTALNQEVGNRGWVESRGRYLVALHGELRSRDLDFLAVNGLNAIPGQRKFRLEGNRLLYVD